MLKIWKDKWKVNKILPETTTEPRILTEEPERSSVSTDGPSETSRKSLTPSTPRDVSAEAKPRYHHKIKGDMNSPSTFRSLDLFPSETSRSSVVQYSPASRQQEGALSQQLHSLDTRDPLIKSTLRGSIDVQAQLGVYATDLFIQQALKDYDPMSIEGEECDRAREIIHIAKNWDLTHLNIQDPSSSTAFSRALSPKLLVLLDILKGSLSYGDDFKCIILVQRKSTAVALSHVISNIKDFSSLRARAVVGNAIREVAKNDIAGTFSSGVCNLIIATKSAENLNLPKASVVIYFDLLNIHLSETDHQVWDPGSQGHIIYMVEQGNADHRRILTRKSDINSTMSTTMAQRPLDPTPPALPLEIVDPYHSDSDDDHFDDAIVDCAIGGHICLQNATAVVQRFASSMWQQNGTLSRRPLFEYSTSRRNASGDISYTCRICLRGSAVDGLHRSSTLCRADSRRLACFAACKQLHALRQLDSRLYFVAGGKTLSSAHVTVQSPLHGTAILPVLTDKGVRQYPRQRAQFWSTPSMHGSTVLFPLVITVANQADTAPYGATVLLTRHPLPPLDGFHIFFGGLPVHVSLTPWQEFTVDSEGLETLFRYTMRLCRAIANKPLTCPSVDIMKYFYAPLPLSWTPAPTDSKSLKLPKIQSSIPWDLMSLIGNTWALKLKFGPAKLLASDVYDAVVIDRWAEFTRRYDVKAVRDDLTPFTKITDGSPEGEYDNVYEYYKSRRKAAQELKDQDQAILEVAMFPLVIDVLNPASRPVADVPKFCVKYLIPEQCNKLTIPASTLRSAILLPSIMRRIDDLLLVKELNANILNNAILEPLLYEAVCMPSAGVELNYERLELLGDTFLKYVTSLYVFLNNPTHDEGALHHARQQLISNKYLLHAANVANLPPYIRGKAEPLKTWMPPGFVVEQVLRDSKGSDGVGQASVSKSAELSRTTCVAGGGFDEDVKPNSLAANASQQLKNRPRKQKDKHSTHWLGDKAVADVVEAIVGAALISAGSETALSVLKLLEIPLSNVERWSDFARHFHTPAFSTVNSKINFGSLSDIEAILGHTFKRPQLLFRALTHNSNKQAINYQRLEFIGDAVLDFMVVQFLYGLEAELTPGAMTALKGAMVSNASLAAMCVQSGLYKHLQVDTSLSSNIKEYVQQLKAKELDEQQVAVNEDRAIGQYWVDILSPPKVLSDVVESVLAAVFISDECDSSGVQKVFDTLMKPFYEKHITLATVAHHPKKLLLELVQSLGCQQLEFVKDSLTPAVLVVVHDIVLATAPEARQASQFALDALEGDGGFMLSNCDCKRLR